MNFTYYVLSSYQLLGKPGFVNSWFFFDPVYGVNINYPNTLSGSSFNSTSGTFVYPVTTFGGNFIPWGYLVQNTTLSADLGNFKGSTTLTIQPSSIDETYYTTLKIVYDFNDNDIRVIEKGIVQNDVFNNVSIDPGSPTDYAISHTYYTPTTTTTFYPSITVINGNLALSIFNLKLTLKEDSLFDFDNFHLINSAQLTKASSLKYKSLEVIELDSLSSRLVSNFLLLSANADEIYNTPYPTPTPTVTPTYTPSSTVTPTITLSPTVTPTTTPTITPTITLSPTNTPTISLSPTLTPTNTSTPTVTPTITPTITLTPTVTPTKADRCGRVNPNFSEVDINNCNPSTYNYILTTFPSIPGVLCYGCESKPPLPDPYVITFNYDLGCIFPLRNCQWPYYHLVTTTITNPYNTPAYVRIIGSVDDDAWISCASYNRWVVSLGTIPPGPGANGSCTAGGFDVTFSVLPNEVVYISGYDIRGVCSRLSFTAYFYDAPITTPTPTNTPTPTEI